MGFLDFIFRRNPAARWPLTRVFRPELDLGHGTFCGVGLEDDVEALARFGKPDNPRAFKENRFVYGESGLIVETREGKIDYVGVAMVDDATDRLKGTTAVVTQGNGASIELSNATMLEAVRTFVDREPEVDRDADEVVERYQLGDLVLEVEAYPNGPVKRVNMFRDTR
jgi:hypothetical protein